MKKIFILSCWRSGTSWLEDILGKKVKDARLFGHEQQILPLLAMYRKCYYDDSLSVRQLANKPLCDIEDFHKELGLKQHKVLLNAKKWSKEEFKDFALRLMEVYFFAYEKKYKQVVEKSPENGSPDAFETAIDIFGGGKNYSLVYLVRDYKPYLASCYGKFIKKGKNDINYYSDKWLKWNTEAIKTLEKTNYDNVFVLSYEDLVRNPRLVEKFCVVWKKDTEIRANVLTKWEQSPIIKDINKLYNTNKQEITLIKEFVNENKIT